MTEHEFYILLSEKYRQALVEAFKEIPNSADFNAVPVVLFTILNELACYIEGMSDKEEDFEHNLLLAHKNMERFSREYFKKSKANKPTDIKFQYD